MSPQESSASRRLPLLTLLIEALEEQDSHDRPNEARALRAFGELALKQVPTRGVFAPADGKLDIAIDDIARKYLGTDGAAKEVPSGDRGCRAVRHAR